MLLEPAGGEYDEDMDIRDEFQLLQSVFLSELGKLTQLQVGVLQHSSSATEHAVPCMHAHHVC